jgi:hypothetical protein
VFDGNGEEVLEDVFTWTCEQEHRVVLAQPMEGTHIFVCQSILSCFVPVLKEDVDAFFLVLVKFEVVRGGFDLLLLLFVIGRLLERLWKEILLYFFVKLFFLAIELLQFLGEFLNLWGYLVLLQRFIGKSW